jgi:alkylation response protein AidB-like acyl-CoA dehydrogenase
MSSRDADPAAERAEPSLDLRSDVRAWCARHVPTDWQQLQSAATSKEYVAFQRWWLRELRAGGYAAPHWPADWGGGFSLADQIVIHEELARANAPRLDLFVVSLNHAPATLLAAGSHEQRRRHLPAILDGEVWCQGFSEPNAGSDLASLTTRAERDGDSYVVNGQKVWSTMAMHAEWCLLLARTDPSAPKRRGISYLLLDMHSPGVDVRPIRNSVGERDFCEIFLTDVAVPVANLVGTENEGWRVAQSTLSTERGTMVLEFAERLRHGLDLLVELASRRDLTSGERAIDDPSVRETLATFFTEAAALRLLCRATIDGLLRHGGIGPQASMIKLFYSELLQRLLAFGVELAGPEAQLADVRPPGSACESGHWLLDFVASWMWTISAGTSEIQRTIVAERVLGLPRDPGME